MIKKEQKYLVVKTEDARRALSLAGRTKLMELLTIIDVWRSETGLPKNSYVVVNEDEPYAKQVWSLIEKQEAKRVAAK